jgi:hypothetical protein
MRSREQSAGVRRAILALSFVIAACGDSGSTASTQVAATSTTTAEDARAMDGPLMHYPDASSPSGNLSTLLTGVLRLDGDCLYLVRDADETEHFPILWPAGTRWDGPNQSVVSPGGEIMRVGDSVEGRGGYFALSDVSLLAGGAARNLAAECAENAFVETAVVENVATAIGPKAG